MRIQAEQQHIFDKNQTQKRGVINNNQNFKGLGEAATSVLTTFDKYPMLSVAFTDTVSTNIPRSWLDLFTTGVPAALETMRREFSGLIVNCLMPSFVVLGVAKLLNNPIMGKNFKNTDMSSSWANEETLNKFGSIFKQSIDPKSKNTTREEITSFVKNTLNSLEGRDGTNWVKFADKLDNEDGKKAVELIVDAIFDKSKDKKAAKNAVNKATQIISDKTHATQLLRFDGQEKLFGSNLSEILRDQISVGKQFTKQTVRENLDDFLKNSKRLVNTKSLAGLGIILPIAMSMQYINRAITRHKYNKKGAPIYKDFENKDYKEKEMNAKEKSKFFMQKIASAGAMVSLAMLSMMKKPSLSMFQFKGMFPTIDQCRWIATGTFVSRMFASEDPNELRESTVRDMASFAGLYFLGDYAAKAAATIIEKKNPDIKLLNKMYTPNATDSIWKKAGNWIRRTSLKSFDEVLPKAKNMRSLCQIASLAFSILTLGIVLPAYNRHVTEKKVQAQKEKDTKDTFHISKLSIVLKDDKHLSQGGLYEDVAQNCFK